MGKIFSADQTPAADKAIVAALDANQTEKITDAGNGITVTAYLDLDQMGEGKFYAYASNGKATFANVGPCDTIEAATAACIASAK